MEQQSPRQYRGFGTVEGELIVEPGNHRLRIGAIEFPVLDWLTVPVRDAVQPGTQQRFDVYPGAVGGKVGFRVLRHSNRPEQGLKLSGCWEERQGVPFLVVYRNPGTYPGPIRFWHVLVPIRWENAPIADGQFWELRADVVGDRLQVIEANGPFEPPPRMQRFPPPQRAALPPPKAKPRAAREQPTPAPPTPLPIRPLTSEEIQAMAIPAKAQLTCRIHQMPEHRQVENQQVEFFLDVGEDKILTVRLKPKQFKKLTNHGYEQWVAAVAGEIGAATATGFELKNATVQVFEKKTAPDAPTERSATAAEKEPPSPVQTVPVSPQPRDVAQSSQQRRRLDGVQIR